MRRRITAKVGAWPKGTHEEIELPVPDAVLHALVDLIKKCLESQGIKPVIISVDLEVSASKLVEPAKKQEAA